MPQLKEPFKVFELEHRNDTPEFYNSGKAISILNQAQTALKEYRQAKDSCLSAI